MANFAREFLEFKHSPFAYIPINPFICFFIIPHSLPKPFVEECSIDADSARAPRGRGGCRSATTARTGCAGRGCARIRARTAATPSRPPRRAPRDAAFEKGHIHSRKDTVSPFLFSIRNTNWSGASTAKGTIESFSKALMSILEHFVPLIQHLGFSPHKPQVETRVCTPTLQHLSKSTR